MSITGDKATFTPKANWNGTSTFTYKATDSTGVASNTATVTVTVTPVNDAPVAQNVALTTPEDTPGSVVLAATDIDSTDLVYKLVSEPEAGQGTATISGNRLTFSPSLNWNGSTRFEYIAVDPQGAASAPAVVIVTVTPVNDVPVAEDVALTTAEDTAGTVTLLATDVESSVLVYKVISAPGAGIGIASITGNKLTFTPAKDWNGSTSLTYVAVDPDGGESTPAKVTITVTPVNDAPVAQNVALTTAEDTAGIVTLLASDVDSTGLIFKIISSPESTEGAASITGNKLTFTPAANWNGTTSLTYAAVDPDGAESSPATVTITVTPVNDAPTVANTTLTTAEDTAGTVTLLGTDIDGDALTYSVVTAPNSAHGTVSITGDKATFTPARDWHGTSIFTYKARDQGGLSSNTATVSITVTPVNDAPVAQDVALSTAEDTTGSVALKATDIDSTGLSFKIISSPDSAEGTASITEDTLTFTPAKDWNGSTSLTYVAVDSEGAESAPATVSITVTPVNDAPVAQDVALSTAEDTAGIVTLLASDVDSTGLTFKIISSPDSAEGTASITEDTLTFTPAKDWNGNTSLTYVAVDPEGAESAPATVSITVTPVNDAPIVPPLNLTTVEDTMLRYELTAADVDSTAPFTFELIGIPEGEEGEIYVDGQELVYIPAEDWNGSFSLQYRAADSDGLWSEAAALEIAVTAANDAPAAVGANLFTVENQRSSPREPWVVDSDIPYGDTHAFAVVSQPAHGQVELVDGLLTYTPEYQYVGGDNFTIRATDAGGLSVDGTAVVTVNPFNYAPTDIRPSNIKLFAGVGGTAAFTVADPNLWDAHVLTVIRKPADAVVSVDGMSITVRTDSAESMTIRLRATDKGGLFVEKDIQVEMVPASEMTDGREVIPLGNDLKLPAISYQLTRKSGNYPLQVTDTSVIEALGDDMVLVVDPDSDVGAKIEHRSLNPGEGMRFTPAVHTSTVIESKAGAKTAMQPGVANLLLTRSDMTGPVYSVKAEMWVLDGQLTSTAGWKVVQGMKQTLIQLSPIGTDCAVSTSKTNVTQRNLLDDPYCFVRWETTPDESRNTSAASRLQMEVIGRVTGMQPVKANAYVYDNEGNEHLIGTFSKELKVDPVDGLVNLVLTPAPEEVYQSIQNLSLVIRQAADSPAACDVTNNVEQARRVASNWGTRPMCFVEWLSVPPGMRESTTWTTPQIQGGISAQGEQIIEWQTSVFTPAGDKIPVTQQSHTVNVVPPPAIELELPATQSRLTETMYSVSTDGGFIGSAGISAVPSDIHVKSQRGIDIVKDEVIVNYGRAVRASTPITAEAAPLWTTTPFLINAAYSRLPEVGTQVEAQMFAVPADTVLPILLNEERVVLDTVQYVVSAQIVDTRAIEDGYSLSKHGDWDIRITKAVPGGTFEPMTDWAPIDAEGRADFALDLSTLTNEVMRVYAEARVRSPESSYYSVRKSLAPLILSVLNGSPLDSEITTLRLVGIAPLRTSFFVSTVDRWEARDIGNVVWEISSDNGATWEEHIPSGNVVQRFSLVFTKGNYLVRAQVENRHSGAKSITPTVEVIAFEVPAVRLQGPQNVFIGDTGHFTLTTPEGDALDVSDMQVEWSEDRGNTWTVGDGNYSLARSESARIYLQARVKYLSAPDHPLAYKKLRTGVSFRSIRPPRVQLVGPRRPEINREATWKANMMMPYPNMGLTMDGFFILPNGQEEALREVLYTPTVEDYLRDESYIMFDGWINGFDEIGGRGITKHRISFWSYDWPNWELQVKSSAIYAPADVVVTLRNLGTFREFEELQVEWIMPEGPGIEVTRDSSTLSRSFTITEPGTYTIAAHVNDARGNYTYVESQLEYFQAPDWGVDLSWSGDNPFGRAPLSVLIRPQYYGGHPKDRIEVKEYRLNGDLLDSTSDYGRAVLPKGTHEISMTIRTAMGQEATGKTIITVVENQNPACSIKVSPGRTSWLAKAVCEDVDGRISAYRWWINGEEQGLSSSSISVPMWRYPEGEPVITVVGVDDSGGESPPVAQK
ncbi:tandem-95 repeat protein [Pseudomonas neustonica]|uniref:tandem-95 repeat protein n=1 Tax=Pseudomonas neustonica TaxID=2487346 RepID=UPI003F48EB8C